MYFSYFVIISTWKFVGSIIWTNLNPLHPRMHYLKFGWNYPSCSGEDDYSNSSMYFCNFVFISPWKRMGPSFEETWNPLHPRYFCAKVWLKLAQLFWRWFFKFINVILQFSSQGKEWVLNLKKLSIPSLKDDLWQDCGNWPTGSGGDILNLSVFLQLRNYLPWKKERPFIWTILNSLYQKRLLVLVCLKLVQWFWRRFLKFTIS